MTTTKTITVSLVDSDDETVQAEYFQIEDGWITFKTEDHKAVVAYPEKRVTRIKTEVAPTDPLTVNVTEDVPHNLFTLNISREFAISRGFLTAEALESAIKRSMRGTTGAWFRAEEQA